MRERSIDSALGGWARLFAAPLQLMAEGAKAAASLSETERPRALDTVSASIPQRRAPVPSGMLRESRETQTNLERILRELEIDLDRPRPAEPIRLPAVPKQRKPRALVIGPGSIGAPIVKELRAMGVEVTVASRTDPRASQDPEKLYLRDRLLDPYQVESVALDAFAAKTEDAALLRRELEAHDLVFICHDPWATSGRAAEEGIRGMRRLTELALEAGFTSEQNAERTARGEPPKRLVYLTSPPAMLPLDRRDGARFHDDNVDIRDLVRRTGSERAYQTPYFWGKVGSGAVFEDAVRRGLDGVSFAPTYVVSEWGDHGGEDPILRMHRKRPPYTPTTLTDAISDEHTARQAISVALNGATGATYQIAGAACQSGTLASLALRHAGFDLPVLRPNHEYNSDGTMIRSLQLLQGERPRDISEEVKLGFLRSQGIEDWHLALLLTMKSRSAAKARHDLGRALDTDPNGWSAVFDRRSLEALRYPAEREIVASIEDALRRQAEGMKARGRFEVTTARADD